MEDKNLEQQPTPAGMPDSWQEAVDYSNLNELAGMLDRLKEGKPTDRSDKARYYAVTITELEKVYAYFNTFVIGDQ